jgi:hypothetical protein
MLLMLSASLCSLAIAIWSALPNTNIYSDQT